MSNLGKAVKSMEQARAVTDPVRELRHWRLEATKRFVAKSIKAAGKGAGK